MLDLHSVLIVSRNERHERARASSLRIENEKNYHEGIDGGELRSVERTAAICCTSRRYRSVSAVDLRVSSIIMQDEDEVSTLVEIGIPDCPLYRTHPQGSLFRSLSGMESAKRRFLHRMQPYCAQDVARCTTEGRAARD